MATLGVVVFSVSGMKRLAQTLESVRWADALLVLHVGEGEPLISVPPRFGSVVRKISPAQDIGAIHEEIQTDWYLYLWGDERVEPELEEKLRTIRRSDLAKAPMSYRIPIRTRLLGRWVNGSLWGPSPAIRLSRGREEIACGWWSGNDRARHDPTGLLRGWIGDYAAVELSDAMQRINGVTSIWVERLEQKGLYPRPATISLISLRVFLRLLVQNGPVAKGMAGLTLASLAAYANLLSGAKSWEARNVTRRKPST